MRQNKTLDNTKAEAIWNVLEYIEITAYQLWNQLGWVFVDKLSLSTCNQRNRATYKVSISVSDRPPAVVQSPIMHRKIVNMHLGADSEDGPAVLPLWRGE